VGGAGPSLGILLRYPGVEITETSRTVSLRDDGLTDPATARSPQGAATVHKAKVSFLGSGNYATAVLIPAFKAAGADLRSVASSAGVSGVHAGRKFGFAETTTDSDRLFADEATDAVVITTRHDSHARFVLQALDAGKHVFVEKPLCLTLNELSEIEAAYGSPRAFGPRDKGGLILMVGFNRRFAPQVQKMKGLLQGVSGPKAMVMTVNAGAIAAGHWTQDMDIGGGRIVGEACHFIDLLRFIAGAQIESYKCIAMDALTRDTVTLQLSFADGSIGTVHYFANGSKSFPKERLEVFAGGRVLQLDNYRKLTGFGWPAFNKMNLYRQDKGQKSCVERFVNAIEGTGDVPIPVEEIFEVSRVAIELASCG